MTKHDPLKDAFSQMGGLAPVRDDLFVLAVQERLQKKQLRVSLALVVFRTLIFGLGLAVIAPTIAATLMATKPTDWGILFVLISAAIMFLGFNRTFRWIS